VSKSWSKSQPITILYFTPKKSRIHPKELSHDRDPYRFLEEINPIKPLFGLKYLFFVRIWSIFLCFCRLIGYTVRVFWLLDGFSPKNFASHLRFNRRIFSPFRSRETPNRARPNRDFFTPSMTDGLWVDDFYRTDPRGAHLTPTKRQLVSHGELFDPYYHSTRLDTFFVLSRS